MSCQRVRLQAAKAAQAMLLQRFSQLKQLRNPRQLTSQL
jgi:hypothetical protein